MTVKVIILWLVYAISMMGFILCYAMHLTDNEDNESNPLTYWLNHRTKCGMTIGTLSICITALVMLFNDLKSYF
jgi:cell division protein FtsW (lipid II flippase)